MKKFALFTGSGSKFFYKLENLLKSLSESKEFESINLFIFDVGMSQSEINIASKYGKVIKPKDHLNFNFEITKPWLRLYSSRPFLKEYAPGFEVYIWIDADIMVFNWSLFNDLCNISEKGKIGIVPEVDVSYLYNFENKEYKKIFKNLYLRRGWTFRNLTKYFKKIDIEKFSSLPCLNAGLFSFPNKNDIWKDWQKTYQEVCNQSKSEDIISMDQTSLNIEIYKSLEKTVLLDAKYNFLVKNSMPMINLENKYVKPTSPFDEIYAIHFTGVDMKLTYEFNRLDDKKIYKKFILN
tara:strand:+ start:1366 stop:2247 length:882 start_codon:yes stop_codon:yes gene_type:complete